MRFKVKQGKLIEKEGTIINALNEKIQSILPHVEGYIIIKVIRFWKPKTGKDSPRWSGGKKKLNCVICKKVMFKWPSDIKLGRGLYCSKKCSNSTRRPGWKGTFSEYTRLHYWIDKHKPKTGICKKCGKKPKRLELSNISGKYKKDIKDYEWLCCKCHRIKDLNHYEKQSF